MLVPPSLASVELKPGQVNSLRAGWRLWELEITPDPETELGPLAEKLGVKLGESAPEVRWVVTPAAAYRETPRGESFRPGPETYRERSGPAGREPHARAPLPLRCTRMFKQG